MYFFLYLCAILWILTQRAQKSLNQRLKIEKNKININALRN